MWCPPHTIKIDQVKPPRPCYQEAIAIRLEAIAMLSAIRRLIFNMFICHDGLERLHSARKLAEALIPPHAPLRTSHACGASSGSGWRQVDRDTATWWRASNAT